MDKEIELPANTEDLIMSTLFPGITVIVPAYNEEKGILAVLRQITLGLTERGWPYEVIVVDDGSQDKTAEVAKSMVEVRVLQHKRNRGYGASLKTGIRHARYQLVAITDADGTYPNDRIPDLVLKIFEADSDMVVGARTSGQVAIPLLRRPAKAFIRWLASFVAGESIPDLNSGLRVFKRLTGMSFFNLLPEGFSFTTTLTLAMLTNGYLIEYVPIGYYSRVGKSKIRPVQDTLNFIQLVLRIALYFAPLKIFLPISILLLLIGLIWAATSTIILGRLADASTAVIIMTAVQVAVLGFLAELLDRRLPNFYRPMEETDFTAEMKVEDVESESS
jgi:glycosyltransferase involved in cell wall biosynthesis